MVSSLITAAEVMNLAAARMNDPSKSVYTFAVQIPCLNLALNDLQEIYQENNVPVTDQTTSDPIQVDSDTVSKIIEIPFDDGTAVGVPDFLPDDLIEIKVAWQSTRGLNQWSRFEPVDYLPLSQIGSQLSSFNNYQWASNCMKVLSANANNDIKLDYIRSLFPIVTDSADELFVINGKMYLVNRTAYYVAKDIAEDEPRAMKFEIDADAALDRSLTISTKGRQKIQTRRMPFRAGFKSRRSGF